MKKSKLLLGTAVVLLGAIEGAQAGTLYISNMQYEGAPNPSAARGTGFLILNDAQTSATVYATHNIATAGTSPLTLGHIHRAPAGVNGPVIFGFTPVPPASPVGPLVWAIPQAELVNLNSAGLYMQFHTQLNPGGEIRGQINRALFATAATTDTQGLVANALDGSAGFVDDLDQIIMARFAPTSSAAARATMLEELAGRTIYSSARQSVETMTGFEDTLFGHAEHMAEIGGDGMGGFVAGGMVFGNRDTDFATAGAKNERPFLLAGFDMGLGEGAAAGIAVGYADSKDDFADNLGSTGVKTTAIQAYFGGAGEGLNFAAVAGYGFVKVDTIRAIPTLARSATSDHKGGVFSIGAKVSMPFALEGNSTIAPYGLVDYQVAKIDAYTETGANSVNLVVPEHKEKNSALELGGEFKVPMGENNSVSVDLSAGYRYLLEDGKETISTRFEGSPVTFNTLIRSPGMSGVHAGVHLTAKIYDNMFFSAGYNGTISSRTTLHALEARLTVKM